MQNNEIIWCLWVSLFAHIWHCNYIVTCSSAEWGHSAHEVCAGSHPEHLSSSHWFFYHSLAIFFFNIYLSSIFLKTVRHPALPPMKSWIVLQPKYWMISIQPVLSVLYLGMLLRKEQNNGECNSSLVWVPANWRNHFLVELTLGIIIGA